MGFMDKAKKMAEQAQAKLDEAQKQFNAGQGQGQQSGPAVEYDAHGRPIPQAPPEGTSAPHGDPLAGQSAAAAGAARRDAGRAADRAGRPADRAARRAGAAVAQPGSADRRRAVRAARPRPPAPPAADATLPRRPRRRPARGGCARRGPQQPELRAAEALERRPARRLTDR